MSELSFTKQHTAFVKGIAILLMIWHHALIPEFYVSPEPFMRSWGMIHLSMGGKFCVGLFTFIMGYGYACSNNHTFSYTLQHIWRLLKQYWALCLLVFFPLGALFGGGTDWQTLVCNLLGLKFQYNCASWFVLFYVYAMVALIPLSKLADAKPHLTLISTIVVFGIAATFINGRVNMYFDAISRWCFYTPVFVVGYVAAKEQWLNRVPQLPAIAYLVLACLILAVRCLVASLKGFITDTIFAPAFVFSIVAFLNKANVASWITTCFQRLGKLSMYMWFLHAIFFSYYTKAIFQTQPIWFNNPFVAFILATIVSYMLAEVALYISKSIIKCFIIENRIRFRMPDQSGNDRILNNMVTKTRPQEIPPINSKSPERQSNFELLRIIAIVLVLVIHADFWSDADSIEAESAYKQSYGFALFTRCFFSSLSCVCVNLFVLVSGWFGIKVSVKGFANLFFTYLYVLLVVIAIGWIIGFTPMSFSIFFHCATFDVYWFFWSYLLLFVLSPVLNAFVQSADKKTCRNVLLCFYIYQTLLAWVVPVGNGFENGLSFIPFIGLYLLAQYLRKYADTIKNIPTTKLTCYYILLLIGVAVIRFIKVPILSSCIVSYMCPTTILMAVLLLLIFSRIKMQSCFVNFVASSAFTIYLLHGHMLLFRPYYRTTMKEIYERYNGLSCFGLIALTCFATFALSIIFDQPRRCIWSKIKSKV